MHHDGGQHHLENLETDGLYGGGESDTDPVRQNYAGTLEIGAANLVVNLDAQDDEQNACRNEPRKHGGKRHALHAHLRKTEIAVQEDDVHDGVRNNRDDVAEQAVAQEAEEEEEELADIFKYMEFYNCFFGG